MAGEFVCLQDRQRFEARIGLPDLRARVDIKANPPEKLVRYVGFASGAAKSALFREADCLCFPSLYPAEGQPVTIIEALAFDLPIVATRWRGIPELLKNAQAELVEGQNPSAIADGLQRLVNSKPTGSSRNLFLARYRVENYFAGLREAFGAL